MKIRRTILTVLTVLWMGLIFFMSAQNADASNEMSGRTVRFVERVFFPDWDTLPSEEYTERHQSLTYLVRKTAHFTEYLILGVFLSLVLMTFPIPWKYRVPAGIAIGAMYAVSDEIHQMFVAGRAMALFDILIDSAGVTVGVLCALGIAAMAALSREGRLLHA